MLNYWHTAIHNKECHISDIQASTTTTVSMTGAHPMTAFSEIDVVQCPDITT